MAAAERYEQVRSDWLLAHEASWTLADRRMANALKKKAAAKDRAKAGAAESSHHEGRIKWIGSRYISRGENEKERAARAVALLIGLATVAVTIGPALVLSGVFYRVSTEVLLKKVAIPRRTAWLLAAAVVAVIGGIVNTFLGMVSPIGFVAWPPQLVIYLPLMVRIGLWVQLTLALALTGWHVRRHGWPGVTAKRATKMPAPAMPAAPKLPAPGEQASPTTSSPDTASEAGPTTTESATPQLPPLPQVVQVDLEDDDIDEYDPEPELEEIETR